MKVIWTNKYFVGVALTISLLAFAAWTALAANPSPSRSRAQAETDFAKLFAGIPGGDIQPCRAVLDMYPEFNGVAVDPKNNIVLFSDTNLKSLLVYRRTAGSVDSPEVTPPLAQIMGPATYISFAAGVAIDPVHKEIYAGENDIGDDVAAFPYGANGDYAARVLATPHEVYGIGVSLKLNQMALAIEHDEELIFFRLGAHGAEPPLREIRGDNTGLADPHGVYWDDTHDEIFVANHGNWARGAWDPDYQGGGRYQPPSITVFSADDRGNAKPQRTIQGSKTRMDWPAGVSVDDQRDEIAVANMASNAITIYSRTANGNVAPIREIKGPRTGITTPMGVAFDPIHHELWVANFGHTGLVFDSDADGDARPKRIIRNAPKGTAIAGFGNPMAMAYDSKRDELLVPN
ncbi:MAG TPA: hypothetical protein VKV28_05035 [Candidatus Binataceae bacterium]|nr:hypothetical protein [Candidatus Binataceae bacterium]